MQVGNRYSFFASKAKKEGYEQIRAVFLETADKEKEHAKMQFKFLEGGEAEIQASYPAGVIGDTKDNLKEAAGRENYEHTTVYPEFEKTAHEGGFPQIAEVMRSIAVAEKQHEKRYQGLVNNINSGKVFKRDKVVRWKCGNCGYVHESNEPP
jgi:rubrerythrin